MSFTNLIATGDTQYCQQSYIIALDNRACGINTLYGAQYPCPDIAGCLQRIKINRSPGSRLVVKPETTIIIKHRSERKQLLKRNGRTNKREEGGGEQYPFNITSNDVFSYKALNYSQFM